MSETAGPDIMKVDGPFIPYGSPTYNRIHQFLIEEATLLDLGMLEEWLDRCLADDLRYWMPVRRNALRNQGSGFDPRMVYFDDNLNGLRLKVRRLLGTSTAWADDPPSRVRRFITNVLVHGSAESERYTVNSSLLLLRNRWDEPVPQIVSALRQDVICATSDGMRISDRKVLADQVTLGTENLAIFF